MSVPVLTPESESDSRVATVATAAKSVRYYLTYKAWAWNGGVVAPEPFWAQASYRCAQCAIPSCKPWKPPFCCGGFKPTAPKRPIAFAARNTLEGSDQQKGGSRRINRFQESAPSASHSGALSTDDWPPRLHLLENIDPDLRLVDASDHCSNTHQVGNDDGKR